MISQILEATTAKQQTNEDRPILSATECSPLNALFSDVYDYVDIAGRSSAMGLQYTLQSE